MISYLSQCFPSFRRQHKSLTPNEAAIKIQKCFRGWSVRQAFLPAGMFTRYSELCDRVLQDRTFQLPQAAEGNTPVYLPEQLPQVILKHVKYHEDICDRFSKMLAVRSAARKLGARCLVIPKACKYREFLVEERMKINVDTVYNMGLYVCHKEAFNQVALEMIRMASKVWFRDFLNFRQPCPLARIESDYVRYDNIPLVLCKDRDKHIGQIILIDLGEVVEGQTPVEDIVRIFPLHRVLIEQEAVRLGLPVYVDACNKAETRGLNTLQAGYIGFAEWLKEEGLTRNPLSHYLLLSEGRRKELVRVAYRALSLAQAQNYDLFCLPNAFLLATSIVDHCLTNASRAVENYLYEVPVSGLNPESLPVTRSCLFDTSIFLLGIPRMLEMHPGISFSFSNRKALSIVTRALAEIVFVNIMDALMRGGEIYTFEAGDLDDYSRHFWMCF